MRAKPQVEDQPPEVQRGRRQVTAVLVTLVGSIVVATFLSGAPLAGMLVQLIVVGLLGLQLFRGSVWARWVLVAFAGFTVVGNAWAGIQSVMSAAGIGWILNFTLAAIYLWCGFFLGFSRALVAFMQSQKRALSSS